MSDPETKARGAENSPAAEMKAALGGFVSDFKEFQAEMSAKFQEQEERLTMLDRKSKTMNRARPALSAAAETELPHQKAFEAYVRSGDDDALRGIELEGKAMSTAVAADGGYLVDPQTSDTIRP